MNKVRVDTEKIQGVVLADQVKSLGWTERDVNFICELDDNTVIEAIAKLSVLLVAK